MDFRGTDQQAFGRKYSDKPPINYNSQRHPQLNIDRDQIAQRGRRQFITNIINMQNNSTSDV